MCKLASEVKHLVNDLLTVLNHWKGTEEKMENINLLIYYCILSVINRYTWSYDLMSKSFYSPWQKSMRYVLIYVLIW